MWHGLCVFFSHRWVTYKYLGAQGFENLIHLQKMMFVLEDLQATLSHDAFILSCTAGWHTINTPPLSAAASGHIWSRNKSWRGHISVSEVTDPWSSLLWRLNLPWDWSASSCRQWGCGCKQPCARLGSPEDARVSWGVEMMFDAGCHRTKAPHLSSVKKLTFVCCECDI